MNSQFSLNRSITTLKSDSTKDFSILQWNTLNSMLCNEKSFPQVDKEFLGKDFRRSAAEKELSSFIERDVDLIALQEVHKDDVDFFKGIFKEKYEGIFFHKIIGVDGCLVLYKKNGKFNLVEEHNEGYWDNEKNAFYGQIWKSLIFETVSSPKKYLVFATTHLKSKAEFFETRNIQIGQLLESLKQKVKIFKSRFGEENISVVLSGDFNDEPDSTCVKSVLDNKSGLELHSVYEDASFTTFKIREKEFKRVIDYIFYSSNLELVERLSLPTVEDIGNSGLPNKEFPSDHLSLYSSFNFHK